MEFFSRAGSALKHRSQCAIVGVFDGGKLSTAAAELDGAAKGLLKRLARAGDLPKKAGEMLLIPATESLSCARVLVVGCGDKAKFDLGAYRSAVTAATIRLSGTGARDAICYLAPTSGEAGAYAVARHGAEAVEHTLYRFTRMKSGKTPPAPKLKKFGFAVEKAGDRARADRGIVHGQAIAEGANLARELGNLPANVCTPTYLAREARRLAGEHKNLSATILNEPDMKKMGMGSLLSVTAGSKQPAKLIVLRYRGKGGTTPPLALVGKGITFDTGGVSLKPPPAMDEMKFDMGGAAGVLGTMASVARLQLPINVVAVVPSCENMPDGTATRPGDIVKSMSGQTIEILNTDAEGRLILCDAITYVRTKHNPEAIIDVATLTGACVIALGHHLTGLFSTHDTLADGLLSAGKSAEDRAWRMPLGPEYNRELSSNFADFANVGAREGGAITAGCFLSRFTEGVPWAHLDIAGTAWKSGKEKGATGRPVPLLTQFLMERSGVLPTG